MSNVVEIDYIFIFGKKYSGVNYEKITKYSRQYQEKNNGT